MSYTLFYFSYTRNSIKTNCIKKASLTKLHIDYEKGLRKDSKQARIQILNLNKPLQF